MLKPMLRGSDSFFDIGTQMISLRMSGNFFMLFRGLIVFEINVYNIISIIKRFFQVRVWIQIKRRS